jgi:DNA-binding transcriptional MerR regulator
MTPSLRWGAVKRRFKDMQDERMQILKMLEQGDVSAEEAARLLDALGGGREAGGPGRGKRLRIEITEPDTGKKKVNLKLPLGLARIATKFIPANKKKELAQEGIDLDEVLSQVTCENFGKLVDFESDDGLIQISIE